MKRSVIDILDLSVAEVDELIKTAVDIADNPEKYSQSCKGKKLAALFFEPSTRTRLSFESAMIDLGGHVIGFADAKNTSVSKGESIADTAKVISCYADIVAMRHPLEGAPLVAAKNASIPVINAGDGGHCHPTQTLADLLTIWREKGRLNDITVGFCGDLKYGRTVHSLISALCRYAGVKVILISPEELKLPFYVKREMDINGVEYVETKDMEGVLGQLDILYMTRVQKERFADIDEYERLKDCYILTEDKMKLAKADTCVLHPLPRVNEISVSIDNDPRACYFKQVANGKLMRMALMLKLLSEKDDVNELKYLSRCEMVDLEGKTCSNPKCITQTEQELKQSFKVVDKEFNVHRCVYCEKKIK
jgi:aspartate carbamoyltransferase catalytic subunit